MEKTFRSMIQYHARYIGTIDIIFFLYSIKSLRM